MGGMVEGRFDKVKVIGSVGRMWADNLYSVAADSITEMLQLSQMQLCGQGEMILYNKATVSYHEMARNQLVEDMEGAWLLQVDTDHVFGPDLLIRLLALQTKYNLPVISAIYQYKHAPHGPVAGLWTGDKTLTPLMDWDRGKDVLEVGVVGGGALLVKRGVFNRIKRELGENPFSITEGLSEDYSFCRRCRKLGIPVNLALNVEAHHITKNILHVGDYTPKSETFVAQTQNGSILRKDEKDK